MKYQQYFNEYTEFVHKNKLGPKYLSKADAIIDISKHSQLLKYNGRGKRVFLIIPSIFNSPEIFFINHSKCFVDYLNELGDVYLLNWLEIENPNFTFNDYVTEVILALKLLNKNVHLIGHCIGGNLAIATTTVLEENNIESLTLMTTPWDFSPLILPIKTLNILNLTINIKHLLKIPKSYIQILFFLLFSWDYEIMINKYCKQTHKDALLFQIQEWLLSGNNLPPLAYLQLIEDIIPNNLFLNNKWQVGDKAISLDKIALPCCYILAEKDKLVTLASTEESYKILLNASLIKVPGGHISYLISNKIEGFMEQYLTWLINII